MTDLQVQNLPVDKIKSSPTQARKYFDEEKLHILADSMKTNGLDIPIQVRLLPDGSYELIMGERRLRAAKLLGWVTIDAIVRSGLSDQTAAVKGLIENLLRADLTPIEEARGYETLSKTPFNMSVRDIATQTGKNSHSLIIDSLSLLKLPPEVQELVERSTISPGHCRHIGKLDDHTQQIAIAQQASKEGWSVKETEKRVNQLLGKDPSPHPLSPGRGPKGEGNGAAQGEAESAPPDPLADFWPDIDMNPIMAPPLSWRRYYGFDAEVKEPKWRLPGWKFWVKGDSTLPKTILWRWAQALADGLKAEAQAEEAEAAKQGITLPKYHQEEPEAPATPPPPTAVPPKPMRDPKIQAMIDRQVAKGRIVR